MVYDLVSLKMELFGCIVHHVLNKPPFGDVGGTLANAVGTMANTVANSVEETLSEVAPTGITCQAPQVGLVWINSRVTSHTRNPVGRISIFNIFCSRFEILVGWFVQ